MNASSRTCLLLLAVAVAACTVEKLSPQRYPPTYPNPAPNFIRVFSTDEQLVRPYKILGEVNYAQPFSADAVDENKIKERLIKIGLGKWPEYMDALILEKVERSADGSTVKVSAKAIQFKHNRSSQTDGSPTE